MPARFKPRIKAEAQPLDFQLIFKHPEYYEQAMLLAFLAN
jgi:hypothetical protein